MALTVSFYMRKNNLFVRLKGEMDQETVKELREKLMELIEKYNIKNIIFNMQELDFMDSSGIGVIIGRYNQLKLQGGKIVLCSLNPFIERIVFLSGLPKICLLKDSEEAAFDYLEAMYG